MMIIYPFYSLISIRIIPGEPICIVGRLFNRSLVTLVSQNDMRNLLVSHSRINTMICNYRYSLTILAVKMNHQRLVVCVEDGIFIHNMRDMKMLHRVEETPPNRNGVIALSTCEDNCYLAYPGSHRVGMVYIFDAMNFQNVTSIAAHDGLLAALAFNANSTLLATASEKGTVIRVFSIPQGDKLMEFRRGLTRCVSICCLSFSLNNQYLVAASHTETLHVFKLETRSPSNQSTGDSSAPSLNYARHRTISASSNSSQPGIDDLADVGGNAMDPNMSNIPIDQSPPHQPQSSLGLNESMGTNQTIANATSSGWGSGLMGWMGSTLKAYSSYLPHQVSEIFSQDRAFAYARLPSASSTPGSAGGVVWTPGRGSPIQGELIGSGGASGVPGAVGTPGNPSTTGLLSQPLGMHKVAAVVYYQNQPRLIVAGLDGLVHTFAIDPVNGGEATLLRTQRLLSPSPGGPSPVPLGQGNVGNASQPFSGGMMGVAEPAGTDLVGPQLTGGPQHPGVYVASSRSSTGAGTRAPTFAAAVAGATGVCGDAPPAHLSNITTTLPTGDA